MPIISHVVVFVGIALAAIIYKRGSMEDALEKNANPIFKLIDGKLWFDQIYLFYVKKIQQPVAEFLSLLDLVVVSGLGMRGSAGGVGLIGMILRFMTTGNVITMCIGSRQGSFCAVPLSLECVNQIGKPFIMSLILLISILAPALVALLLAVLPKKTPNTFALGWVLPVSLFLRFFLFVYLLPTFRQVQADIFFRVVIDTGLSNLGISLKLGVNGVSAPLFLLAGIVGLAAGLTAVLSVADRKRTYLALLLAMQAGLMGIFCTYDIFYIYFFHEFALIPTFYHDCDLGWSSSPCRCYEMTIYLTLGAMLSLVGLIGIYAGNDLGSFDLITLAAHVKTVGMETAMQNSLLGC